MSLLVIDPYRFAAAAALVAPTVLDEASVPASTGTTAVTDTVTPSNGALLIAAGTFNGTTDVTMSTTLANVGSWSYIYGSPFGTEKSFVAWATITGSPGSGTVTATGASSINARRGFVLCEVASGYDTTTPVSQSKGAGGSSSAPSVTLDSTPAASSMVLAYVGTTFTSVTGTAGTGFTELFDSVAQSSRLKYVEYDLTSAAAAAAATLSGAAAWVMLAIEIAAA